MRFRISENEHVKKHESHEQTLYFQQKEIERLSGNIPTPNPTPTYFLTFLDTIQTKVKECNNLLELCGQQENENKALRAKIDSLLEQIHHLEIKKNKEKEQLKARLD